MSAATQTTIDLEREAQREADRRYTGRNHKYQRQAARAIIVCRHHFDNGHDADPRIVCASYDDVLEYGRMVYGSEDVVLLDQRGRVIEDAEGKRWFSRAPRSMARGKDAEKSRDGTYRYVDYPKRGYDVSTVRVATFRDDLDIPVCGPCKRAGEGKYVTGPKDDPARFDIERSGSRSSFSGIRWSCRDTKTGEKHDYNSRKRDAIAHANRMLRTEACAQQIAEGFVDPERYI
jgi:hypothetical protein